MRSAPAAAGKRQGVSLECWQDARNVPPTRPRADWPEHDACGRVTLQRQETAMIRRVAGLAVLLTFSLWGAAQAQTASDYTQGVTVSGTAATESDGALPGT